MDNTNTKERMVLSVLYNAKDYKMHGYIRLEKILFLLQQEVFGNDKKPFEFEQGKFGPTSEDVMLTSSRLDDKGLITYEKVHSFDGTAKYVYNLSPRGAEYMDEKCEDDEIEEDMLNVARDLVDELEKKPISLLIDDVYYEYPDYSGESVH